MKVAIHVFCIENLIGLVVHAAQNGMHSLCPAVWSKHRRWLLMSMICLNPFACVSLEI